MLFSSGLVKMSHTKITCHGAGLVSADTDLKNSFTVFVDKGKISGISVAFEGKLIMSIRNSSTQEQAQEI